MVHSSLVAILLSLELVSQAPGRASSWVTVQSKEGGFSFSMPGKPREQSPGIPGRNGQAKIKVYTYTFDDNLLLVQHVTLPRAVPPNMVAAQLEAAKKSGNPNLPNSAEEKWISAGDVNGLEFSFIGPSAFDPRERAVKAHIFIKGSTYCSMIVLAPPNKPFPREADRFLDSIRFVGGPAPGTRPRMPAKSAVPAGRKPPTRIDLVDKTPEDALRTFLMATAAGDEQTLRTVTLPNRDLDVLLTGQTVPAEEIPEMKQMMLNLPIKTLKVGDQVKLPGNKLHVIHGGEVGPDYAALLPEGAPTLTHVRRVNGHWKVDAGPVIAGRKAADAARRKARPN